MGRVDQWGESGYLFFDGHVYAYEEDRKDQCGRTYLKMTVPEFVDLSGRLKIDIPAEFMASLKEN